MNIYNSSLRLALQATFPEVDYSSIRKVSSKKPKGYWKDIHNCRTAFDSFARDQGFDPLDADKWQAVDLTLFTKVPSPSSTCLHFVNYFFQKGVRSITAHHGSIHMAVELAYPELQFFDWASGDNLFFPSPLYHLSSSTPHSEYPNQLSTIKEKDEKRVTAGYWKDVTNVRSFFDDFAKEKGFDSGNPESWYALDIDTLQQYKVLIFKRNNQVIRFFVSISGCNHKDKRI